MTGRRTPRSLSFLCLLVLPPASVVARNLMTQAEALRQACPDDEEPRRDNVFLTDDQRAEASARAGTEVASAIWIRYLCSASGDEHRTVYFDTHVVRTLPETLMVVIGGDGTVERVEVVSFAEPSEYLPRPAWYRQFAARQLDDDLAIDRGIRAVTGATLSARTATQAVRRVLALHRVLLAPAEPASEAAAP